MLKLYFDPIVRVINRPSYDDNALQEFLAHNGISWEPGGRSSDGELAVETAGRLCYMSFGKPRPGGSKAYMDNILSSGHGSVLEHANWCFIVEGVSRSLSHELVRHRAGFGYSQLSQRYVDGSNVAFVVPPELRKEVEEARVLCVSNNATAFAMQMDANGQSASIGLRWLGCREADLQEYAELTEYLFSRNPPGGDKTAERKAARGAARSCLPNATETKMFVTGNVRALRHFVEMRASKYADAEIRKLAIAVLKLMQVEAPLLFADYTINDGTQEVATPWRKV